LVANRFFAALGNRLGPPQVWQGPATEGAAQPALSVGPRLQWFWVAAGIVAAALLAYLGWR
jgi:hypothetical protein